MDSNDITININEYVVLNSNTNSKNLNDKGSNTLETSYVNINQNYIKMKSITNDIFSPIINKLQDTKLISEKVKKKVEEILKCLNVDNVDNLIHVKTLKRLIFEGIPDEFPSCRSLLWKLMLNYMPQSITEWNEILIERKLDYENIKMDYIENESDNVYNEIIKDVKRTKTHLHLFQQKNKKSNEVNSDILARILYIFAKLHPDISYVQGMNEISATIFYCFSCDSNPFFQNSLEADTFYCFETLMLEIKEMFLKEKDDTESGIHYRLKKIDYLLEYCDKELYEHFVQQRIETHFFMFRWYTLLFTQEFNMPDIMRLWDALLTQSDKFEFITYVCISIVIMNRRTLLTKDFSSIMHLMQNLNLLDINIESLIRNTEKISLKLSNMLISF